MKEFTKITRKKAIITAAVLAAVVGGAAVTYGTVSAMTKAPENMEVKAPADFDGERPEFDGEKPADLPDGE